MIYYDWYDIYSIMETRRSAQSPIIRQMVEVRDRYNADWVLPDFTAEVAEVMPNLSPQLVAETVDNYGMRAGSVQPGLRCPPVTPSRQKGPNSRQYAEIRGGILMATYKKSRMPLLLRKAYRHMTGYAMASMIAMPDFQDEFVRISLRDPLNTFPDAIANEDFRDPENVGFIFAKSGDWIAKRYPEVAHIVHTHPRGTEVMWNMVEWIDCYHTVIGLLGPQEYPGAYGSGANRFANWEPHDWSRELRRWENPIGRVPAIVPGRVTLDRIASQLANILGTTDMMARLTALDIAAKEKAIYPDKYIIGKNGQIPRLVTGDWADGRTGKINVISDADGIGSLNFQGDVMAQQGIDRLERNARVSLGLVPQFGGETYGALRTGRGIDALAGMAVDPRIMEMHNTMETWLESLNESILAQYKEYWPNKTFVMPTGKFRPDVEFVPSKHIESLSNEVSYSVAGADVQGVTITLGQMLGMKTLSKRSFMERHPFIGDAAAEMARIDEEMAEEMTWQALSQAVASGAAPPIMLTFVEEERRKDPHGDIITAVQRANERMQELQAQQAPPPQEGQVAAPETQPGITGPAQQAPAPEGQPGIETPPDLGQLRTLMNALGQTSGMVRR